MLFQKYINNPTNFNGTTFTEKGAQKFLAEVTGRSILEKVQDFSLADIDTTLVANCIKGEYLNFVSTSDFNNAFVANGLTTCVGFLVGGMTAYGVGRGIEKRASINNHKPYLE